MNNLRKIITHDSITLYWDKVANQNIINTYQIWVNGELFGTTDKTHYTIDKLEADSTYVIKILAGVDSTTVSVSTAKEKEYIDVTKPPYYAKGDGVTLNTVAIQKAINDCRAEQAVYIPAGIFLTGSLRLHSDMEIYVEEGAVLQGTEEVDDYLPKINSRFEGLEMKCYSSLLNMGELDNNSGYNCRNIVIRGKGTIASGGRKLAQNVISIEKERLKEYMGSLGDEIYTYENFDTIPGRVRPRLINISNCQNVLISGVTLKNGASWNVHMIYSDNIVTHGCTFYSKNVWNGDGWDPDSSTNCTIFNCKFYTQDDSIAIKSGKNPEGNIINKPCEHIRIFDCVSVFGHGIAIGSEMSGGVRDVKIWDCDLANTRYGVEIKGTKKRGSFVRDIHVRDCTVSRVLFHAVGYNDDGIGAKHPPLFEDCTFENLYILGEYTEYDDNKIICDALELIGFDESGYEIKNITFKDILLQRKVHTGPQNISIQYCKNITLQNVEVKEKTM